MAHKTKTPSGGPGLSENVPNTLSDIFSVAEPRSRVTADAPDDLTAGSRRWRLARGLLTIGDLVLDYRCRRHPRGDYRGSLPEDRLPGWRAAA